jgi:iron complex outermembrane receptor protein
MKNIFKLIITILFFSNPLFAQSVLKGKVTDKNNLPLSSLTVFIPEIQKGTITDSVGAFSIETPSSGIVNVQFTMIGYKSQVKTVNLADTAIEIKIMMEPSATELEEVLVTSNNSKLSDAVPFSANNVSEEEIRKYSSPSLMGNLSYQPGIDRITIGNGIGKPVIRGLSFNRIMLYGQGTRIENQQWDDHHDLGLTDIGIENVEVVRGPAALIYGADALGGALIFVDEKPASIGTTVGDVNVGFGSNNLGINMDAGIKSANKSGLFYGARFGGQSNTSYLQGEDDGEVKPAGETEEFAPNSKSMLMNGKANIGLSKKWGVSKLSYSYLNQKIGIIEDESSDTAAVKSDEAEQRDREMEAPYQDVTTQIISLENTVLLSQSKLNINVAYQINDRKEYEPLPEKQKDLAICLKLNTVTYDIKWTSNAVKEFGYTIGSQGTFLQNKNNGHEALVPDADVRDVAGYGLLRYDHDKLNLLGGVRYDMRHIEAESYEKAGTSEEDIFIQLPSGDTIDKPETDFEKNYTPVSFSLGAAYHLNEKLTVKLNGATGFSAPNYAQLGTFGKHEGTYRFERGDVDLKVEQNAEGDLGFVYENNFLTLSLDGYYNKIMDYIYIENTGDTMVRITPDATDTLPIYDYKQNDATISGGEFGFDIHPSTAKWLDLKASYAIINGTLDKDGSNLPYIPANKLTGEIKLSKEKLWVFSNAYVSFIISNYAQQKNVAQYELSTEGYTLLDAHLGAGFKLAKHTATLDIFCTNLLNTAYFNQLSLVKYINVRDMGRNIGFQLRVPFGD